MKWLFNDYDGQVALLLVVNETGVAYQIHARPDQYLRVGISGPRDKPVVEVSVRAKSTHVEAEKYAFDTGAKRIQACVVAPEGMLIVGCDL